jgi:hypothetical protein
MLITAILCFLVSVGATAVVHSRLCLFRHDQAWRRERGAIFGDSPIGVGWMLWHRKADYAPEGHRLIPYAVALPLLSVVFFGIALVLYAA